jgi:hypothetical protein
MTTPVSNPLTTVRALLDRGYATNAALVVNAITRNLNSGIIARRLIELENEALRLIGEGQKLDPSNPVLRALRADLEETMRANAALVNSLGSTLQNTGQSAAATLARTLTIGNLTDQQLASFGVQWRSPDPEAVNALLNYTRSEAWADEMKSYTRAPVATIQEMAIQSIIAGTNPLQTARDIAAITKSMPLYRAEALMRTLQLQSYRDATVMHFEANSDILEYAIRVAVLDARTCLACIAEHGSILQIGEPILDHHNGRCTAIGKVRAIPRSVQTGEQWFNSLTEAEQQRIAGPGAFELLKSGKAKLADFVQTYRDPVFGDMIKQASLTRLTSSSTSLPPAPNTSSKPLTYPQIKSALKRAGYKDLEIRQFESDISDYLMSDYRDIRGAVIDGVDYYDKDSGNYPFRDDPDAYRAYVGVHNNIVRGLEQLPRFRGTIIRAIDISLDDVRGYDAATGLLREPAITSWSDASSLKDIGTGFTRHSTTIFRIIDSDGIGVSVRTLSQYRDEEEVLALPAIFRVVSLTSSADLPSNSPFFKWVTTGREFTIVDVVKVD